MQNGARMALMRPELDALTAKIKAQKDATFEQQAESSKKMQGLFTKYNCHPVKSIMGPLVQVRLLFLLLFP
jgi:membrane protein insertase Oxa1/YidC/SpoIIIJ